MGIMTQTILNFKLKTTNGKFTPRTGVAILGEYLKGVNLEKLCNDNLPKAIYQVKCLMSKNCEFNTKIAKSIKKRVKNM